MSLTLEQLQTLLTDPKALKPYIDIDNEVKVFLHFIEEVGEFSDAWRRDDKERLKEEIGDIQILLLFLAESLDINLEEVTISKIKKNIQNGKFGGAKNGEKNLSFGVE